MHNKIILPDRIIETSLDGASEVISSSGKTFILAGPAEVFEKFKSSFNEIFRGKKKIFVPFGGECTTSEVEKICSSASAHNPDFIFGFGGGKAIDASKSASFKCGIPIICAPTSAATCAGFAALSVIYGEKNEFLYEEEHPSACKILLFVKDFLSTQPAYLLASGAVDCLAKWWEFTFNEGNTRGAFPSFARSTVEEIFSRKSVFKNPSPEDSYEISRINIIHAGILSAFGGKDFRASAAHAISYGFTWGIASFPPLKNLLHGELVGIGMLASLFLLGRTSELILLRDFYAETGILHRVKEFANLPQNVIAEVAKRAVGFDNFFKKHNFDFKQVENALKKILEL